MIILEEAADLLEKVREQVPLVHNIANYVTVNDCANAALAIGGFIRTCLKYGNVESKERLHTKGQDRWERAAFI